MSVSERAANVVFAVNIFTWGISGVFFSEPECRWTVVRICISAMHCIAGMLFLRRGNVVRHGSKRDVLLAVPSLLVCGFVFSLAPPTNQWPWYAEALFAIGTLFTVISLSWLGDNFAVFPAIRSVTITGPYSMVRHPAYAGEILLVFACCAAASNVGAIATSLAMSLLLLPLVVVRIHVEERLLESNSKYAEYRENVRWRLVPGVW